jgi:hypothetical protein
MAARHKNLGRKLHRPMVTHTPCQARASPASPCGKGGAGLECVQRTYAGREMPSNCSMSSRDAPFVSVTNFQTKKIDKKAHTVKIP